MKSYLTHYVFSGLEPTRKTLLLTTTENKYNAQLEADELLTKHFKNTKVARRSPTRQNNHIINNHFSTDTEHCHNHNPQL